MHANSNANSPSGKPENTITGVILAGGRAQRMGGQDKGLLRLGGRPMIAYVLASLQPQVDEVLINANRHIEQYRQLGCPVISDQIAGFDEVFAGPLAGMAAAMEVSRSDYILSVPCDGPWVPADLAARLLQGLREQDTQVATVHDGQRMQPVFALISCALLPQIKAYLQSGERKLGLWIRQQQPALVDFSDQLEAFFNVNSPQELELAETRLKAG